MHLYLQALMFLFTSLATHCTTHITYTITKPEQSEQHITINLPLKKDELLYADSLMLEIDHPAFELKTTSIHPPATTQYDPVRKETKRVYEGLLTLQAIVLQKAPTNDHDIHVHISYATNKQPSSIKKLIPLEPSTPEQKTAPIQQEKSKKHSANNTQEKKQSRSLATAISDIFKNTDSTTIKLILALLLGILLSLTPCIYPMIPLTLGILQSYGTQSFMHNTIRSLLYAMGMATTFALLGLLASCTGPFCGYLLANPLFVYTLVAFLTYLAGSMLGLYDLYIPRFMQMNTTIKVNSLASVFLFGLASGTISSPCVSPGLALILSVVATLGNKILGFLLLFLFGIGLSMPLLIVGIFSGSLQFLPRSGQWMVEIKKLFGFLIIAQCIYYLTTLHSWNTILFLITIVVACTGILYLVWAQSMKNALWKKIYTTLGILTLATSVGIFSHALILTFFPDEPQTESMWTSDFTSALHIARQENKLVFVDVWAQFCSICKVINTTLLADEIVTEALQHNYVLVKIDGTVPSSEPYATVQKQYAITGFPTFLVINPDTQEVIKRWDSKIYNFSKEKFIGKIQKYALLHKKK